MVNYENIYPGADDFLVSSYYNPIGYQTNVDGLGMSTDPRTANQLSEIDTKLNPGVKTIEISAVDAKVFEAIPDQHLKEINRLSKLTGVTPSIHVPVIEASGVTQDGWSEADRVGAEKQLESAMLRSHKLDPQGNIMVTTHTTAGLPEMEPEIITKEDGKTIRKPTKFWIVDPRTGKFGAIKPEKKFFPEQGKFKEEGFEMIDINKELDKHNQNQWVQSLSGVNRYAVYGENTINEVTKRKQEMSDEKFNDVLSIIKKGEVNDIKDEITRDKAKSIQRELNHGEIYLKDAYQNMKGLFDTAYSSSTGKDRENLTKFAQEIAPQITPDMEKDPEKLKEFGEIIEKGLKVLSKIDTPKIFVPLKEFVIDKSSQTFANVASSAYNEYGKTAPILNLENPPAGMGLNKAEDVKKLVIESREKFAKNLKEKGVGKSEAKKISEKMIGATWDLGHINMLRKQGYSEKDIVKQTEIIAPYVKHVHLSDNFGFEHTELPMGMGNVPVKEMMKKLGEKGFEGKKIIEAAAWWQYFAEKGGPFKPTIEAFDSPIYSMKAGPSWGDSPSMGSYYIGQGPINPAVHHSVYGTGFSTLPQELGGQIPGEQSRFAGTPNQ